MFKPKYSDQSKRDLEKKNMKGGLNSSLDTAKELIKQLNSGDTDFAFQVRKKSYGLPFNDASIFSNHFSGHIRFFFIPFQPTSSFVYSITYKYHYQFSSVQHSGEVATHLLWTAGKWTVIFLLIFLSPSSSSSYHIHLYSLSWWWW